MKTFNGQFMYFEPLILIEKLLYVGLSGVLSPSKSSHIGG